MNVFVYGSLKRGFHNHSVLDGAKFAGEATLNPKYTMYSLGGYPAIVPDGKHPSQIIGELYEVDNAGLARLDMLEGYPSYYNRRKEIVNTERGGEIAWVYYIEPANNNGNNDVVKSGLWKNPL
jgi:gamma-glutamylaminecyclotransferase